MFKTIIIILLLSLTACSKESCCLVVGTNAAYYPYEFTDETGELTGFDIELAHLIANKMGKELVIKEMTFDGLVLALKQGKIDLIISGMSILESRQQQMNMIPYQGATTKSLMLAFWEKAPPNINLSDKIISTQTATFQAEYLNKLPDVEVRTFDSNIELIMDIKYNKSYAALFEPHIAEAIKNKVPEIQWHEMPLPPQDWTPGNGIGIAKTNEVLTKQIDKIIKTFLSDGTIHSLENKWFGGEEL